MLSYIISSSFCLVFGLSLNCIRANYNCTDTVGEEYCIFLKLRVFSTILCIIVFIFRIMLSVPLNWAAIFKWIKIEVVIFFFNFLFQKCPLRRNREGNSFPVVLGQECWSWDAFRSLHKVRESSKKQKNHRKLDQKDSVCRKKHYC